MLPACSPNPGEVCILRGLPPESLHRGGGGSESGGSAAGGSASRGSALGWGGMPTGIYADPIPMWTDKHL